MACVFLEVDLLGVGMFGTSGIRGEVGETVTAELGLRLGRAVGSVMDPERAVVGRDPRVSGEFLCDAVSAGLRESGVAVVNVGVAATPTIARSVGWQDAGIGIAVTASHNPPKDNGFKVWTPSGQAIDPGQQEALSEAMDRGEFDLVGWESVGEQSAWNGATDRHLAALAETVSFEESLEVVVDVGNGAGGVTPAVLGELGCEVTTLNAQPDGRFPGRKSEPHADSLEGLMALVEASDADLGIAHDGDADRMMAVDDTGSFVSGDELLALFARAVVTAGDRVAAPVNTSLLVDDALAAQDASVVRTKVGDGFVASATTEDGVVFGGEPSGAWIWPDETLCPDGPLAAVKLAELIAANGPLSEQRDELGAYPLRRESFEVADKAAVFGRVVELVVDAFGSVETLDGVRVSTDSGWLLIRPSGTQPLIRVTAEARTSEECARLFEEGAEYVQQAR